MIRFKKTLSLVLAFALTLSMGTFASNLPAELSTNATTLLNSYGSLDDVTLERVDSDLTSLSDFGFSSDILSIESITDDDIFYEYSFSDEISSIICVKEIDDGTELTVYENNKVDVLILTDDNELFLNGNQVTVTTTYYNDLQVMETSVSPRGRTSQYSESPFTGTASQYNTYYSYYSSRVDVGTSLSDITFTSLSAIIGNIIGGLITISSIVAGLVKDAAVIYAPDENWFSYYVNVYEHDTDSWTLNLYLKHEAEYFVGDSFDWYVTDAVFYEYNFFS